MNVERYVLPKFKVAVEFSGKDSHAKHGYRPGDHVTGTVRANYFFGKPVDDAEVTVKGSAMDVAVVDAGLAQGKTDADGAYRFDLVLPNYFAGLPLNQGPARVLIEATVKDSAGHSRDSRGAGHGERVAADPDRNSRGRHAGSRPGESGLRAGILPGRHAGGGRFEGSRAGECGADRDHR